MHSFSVSKELPKERDTSGTSNFVNDTLTESQSNINNETLENINPMTITPQDVIQAGKVYKRKHCFVLLTLLIPFLLSFVLSFSSKLIVL